MSFEQYVTPVEQKIARQLVDAAINSGYTVSVKDGVDGEGEWVVRLSDMTGPTLAALATTEGDTLRFRDVDGTDKGPIVGHIVLVWGNGPDLIHDFTDNAAMSDLVRAALIGTDNEGLF